jgi:phosphonate transport system ATP-binding protein
MTETLRIEGLTKRFGATVAVDGAAFDVPPGQFVGIVGPSGAGKSTLLRMIDRLVEPDAGAIRYGARDVLALRGRELRRWRARAAMVFQQFNLIPRLDVLTNVLLGRLERRTAWRGFLGLFPPEDRAEALAALDRFDLLDTALQRAGTLSGGQQQRVAIVRCLMQDPWLILADEPIASLDPRNSQLVMQALRAANRERGLTVLANLHHLDAVRSYCDRVVALRAGRVVLDGTPRDLTPAAVQAIYGVAEHEIERDPA